MDIREYHIGMRCHFNQSGTRFIDRTLLIMGVVSIDLPEFDKWLKLVYGKDYKDNQSIEEFVRLMYGDSAVNFIHKIILEQTSPPVPEADDEHDG